MALIFGDTAANTGMSKTIYDSVRQVMEPIEGVSEQDMTPIRDSWKKLSYAVAKGVIEHMKSNMEISGVTTQGNVNTSVHGSTGSAVPSNHANHVHLVNLNGVDNNVEFTQNNSGTGLIS